MIFSYNAIRSTVKKINHILSIAMARWALKMAGNNWRQSILGDYDQMNLANEKYVYKEGLGLQRGYSVYFAWV